MSTLKERVLEIAEIAGACPENLQQICFELLLKNEIGMSQANAATAEIIKSKPDMSPEIPPVDAINLESNQEDLTDRELHAKARSFMQKKGVTIEQLNNLFYKEGGNIETLYDDLKTTKMAEGQMRIALLQALQNGLTSGEFSTTVERVRSEATDRKYYDPSNFARNFKNNTSLFDFGEWSSDVQTLKLSDEGKSELASVIKELQ